MKVLSLFDGISAGQLALQRANKKVDQYYASEIDKYAIQLTQRNFPNTIQLGDVTKWKEWDIPWGEIDLVIGGSPCQGFSFAGKQLNFDDPRSALFFVFVDICHHVADHNPKMRFLLENVRMKRESQEIISGYMGVEPIPINSSLVSAQNRYRLYWTNIPNVTQPIDQGIVLRDILETKTAVDPIDERMVTSDGKAYCLTARYDGAVAWNSILRKQRTMIAVEPNNFRKLTPVECERLQTFPDHFTEGVSNTQRYKALGNSWTVDVITHIFKNL